MNLFAMIRKMGRNKYIRPHMNKQERKRHLRQMKKGMLKFHMEEKDES